MFDRFNKWYDKQPANLCLAFFLTLLVVAIFLFYIGVVGQMDRLRNIAVVLFLIDVFAGVARALKARRKL